jgi:hypothetical protein
MREKIVTCPECKHEMTERGFKYFHIKKTHKMDYFTFMLKHGENLVEGKDYVVCKICRAKCARLGGGHLEKIHGKTCDEYLKEYPNSQLHCGDFSSKQRDIKRDQYKHDPALRQKAGKRSYKSEFWQMLPIPEPRAEEDYLPPPITNSIFTHEPSIEQAVILLFGQMCDKYNITIEQFWSHKFPDCKGLIKSKKKRDRYIPIYIEFEPKSSNVQKHKEINDGSWKKTSPLLLVCWEHDSKQLPKAIVVLELKTEIEKLRKIKV